MRFSPTKAILSFIVSMLILPLSANASTNTAGRYNQTGVVHFALVEYRHHVTVPGKANPQDLFIFRVSNNGLATWAPGQNGQLAPNNSYLAMSVSYMDGTFAYGTDTDFRFADGKLPGLDGQYLTADDITIQAANNRYDTILSVGKVTNANDFFVWYSKETTETKNVKRVYSGQYCVDNGCNPRNYFSGLTGTDYNIADGASYTWRDTFNGIMYEGMFQDSDGDTVSDSSDCAPNDATKWQNLTGYLDEDGDQHSTGDAINICSGAALAAGYMSTSTTADCAAADNTKWQLLTGYSDPDGDGYGKTPAVSVCSGDNLPAGFALEIWSPSTGVGSVVTQASTGIQTAAKSGLSKVIPFLAIVTIIFVGFLYFIKLLKGGKGAKIPKPGSFTVPAPTAANLAVRNSAAYKSAVANASGDTKGGTLQKMGFSGRQNLTEKTSFSFREINDQGAPGFGQNIWPWGMISTEKETLHNQYWLTNPDGSYHQVSQDEFNDKHMKVKGYPAPA